MLSWFVNEFVACKGQKKSGSAEVVTASQDSGVGMNNVLKLEERLAALITSLTPDQQRAIDSLFSTCTGDSRSTSLSREQFVDYVDSLPWGGDAGAAWAELVEQAKAAQGIAVEGANVLMLTRQDIEALYLSLPYNCDRIKAGVENEIRGLIAREFREIDKDGAGVLTMDKVLQYGRKKGMDEAAIKSILDSSAVLDFNAFMNTVLILNDLSKDDEQELKEHKFYPALFNPVHTSEEKFLQRMIRYAENHKATDHPIYNYLIKNGSAATLLEFLREYRCFGKGLAENLQRLIAELPVEDQPALQQKLAEELGQAHSMDQHPGKQDEMRARGIDVQAMLGVDHATLYRQALGALAREAGRDEVFAASEPVADSPGQRFKAAMAAASAMHGTLGALAVMLCASDHVVPKFYAKTFEALKRNTALTPAELVLFPLCTYYAEGRAGFMPSVLRGKLSVQSARRAVHAAVSAAMAARWAFLEEMMGRMKSLEEKILTGSRSSVMQLYDKQSTNWERKEPTCLSDFTGRPVVFEALRPHLSGASVLDVGCGEGYCTREVRRLGAQKVVGIDVSQDMINSANKAEAAEPLGSMFYIVGDATKSLAVVKEHGPSLGVVAEGELGVFDVAMGVFIFNYISISDMMRASADVFALLKPGGVFVFSVPHPALTVMEKVGVNSRFHFRTGGYFSSRDEVMEGEIMTRDGKRLNVRNRHKTIGDYTQMIKEIGFELLHLDEAAVTEEHLAMDPDFFGPMKDRPLHLIFKVQKPDVSILNRRGLGSDLSLMPAQVFWSGRQQRDPSFCTVPLPTAAWKELRDAVVLLVQQRGRTVDTYDIGEAGPMPHTVEFGARLRRMILRETGAILTRLPIEEFQPPRGLAKDEDQFEEMSRMAYFLVCSAAGRPDESTRGRCFDVRAVKGLDPKQANVLFSVVDTEAGWHTDGAAADRFVDTTALLSIRKAKTGGAFQVANACNALSALRTQLPAFLMHELTRALPRDVLEKGAGKGTGQDYFASQRKNPEMVALRVFRNHFPIYALHQDSEDHLTHMRFRYMRFWIESGHTKASFPMSPFLRIACDFLDKALTEACCFNRPMEPGEVAITNNHLIAHARDAFHDDPDPNLRGRHKVRVWISVLPLEQELGHLERE